MYFELLQMTAQDFGSMDETTLGSRQIPLGNAGQRGLEQFETRPHWAHRRPIPTVG